MSRWIQFIQYVPLVVFVGSLGMQGIIKSEQWTFALSFAGLCAIAAILLSIHNRLTMNRLFLGVNVFLLLGACGVLFNLQPLLEWYDDTTGGPFFTCIFAVGLLTTLCTKAGFIGANRLSSDAVRYGSFLLLSATLIALIWSVKADDQGIMWATVLPFIALCIIDSQIVKNLA